MLTMVHVPHASKDTTLKKDNASSLTLIVPSHLTQDVAFGTGTIKFVWPVQVTMSSTPTESVLQSLTNAKLMPKTVDAVNVSRDMI
jgi:hypothetical protein